MGNTLRVIRLQPWAALSVVSGLLLCLGFGFTAGLFYSHQRPSAMVSGYLPKLSASDLAVALALPSDQSLELAQWIKERAVRHQEQPRWVF